MPQLIIQRLHRTGRSPVAVLLALMITLWAAAVPSLARAAGPRSPTAANSTPTSTRAPMLFAAPVNIDHTSLNSLACPTTTLCVATDRSGTVLWSTAPTHVPVIWRAVDVDGANTITAVACPATNLCVAVDGAGNVISSTDPSGGATAWTVTKVDTARTAQNTDNGGAVLMRAIACPSTALCVAVDAAGNAWTSTDPTGGAGAWTMAHIDTATTYACTPSTTAANPALACQPPLVGVACPSTSACAAVDFAGNIFTTADPQAPTWTPTPAPGSGFHSLWSIACPQMNFCLTVDGQGAHAIGFDPASPAIQKLTRLPGPATGVWCASAHLCLAAAESPGGTSVTLASGSPSAANPMWYSTPLGDLNAVACPGSALCVGADDEGNVVTGLSSAEARLALDLSFFRDRTQPSIARLDRHPRERFTLLSPIPAQVSLSWASTEAQQPPLIIASLRHSFIRPGSVTLSLALNPAGRTLFQTATRPVRIRATATFSTPTGTVVQQRSLTFRSPPHRRRARSGH